MNRIEVVHRDQTTYDGDMKHIPYRKNLTDAEVAELDDIMAEHQAAREAAREAFLAAHTVYQNSVSAATDRRDNRILDIIDAVDPALGQGTQSRIVEHLGMNPTYLSIRVRRARTIRAADMAKASPPGPKPLRGDASLSTH
jgi:hypothetical protein